MIPAKLSANEEERLKALERYAVMDTAPEKDLNDIVLLASQICNTPISLISLVDNYRQWFKARIGLPAQETHRDLAFCAHAILGDKLFEVQNATEDDRFKDNPLVTADPSIRFYAGVPLRTSDNYNLGTLCVIDRVPRQLTDLQKNALRTLSSQVIIYLELKLKITLLEAEHRHNLEKTQELLQANKTLKETQIKLFQTEKRSAMNMVSASLAHELNNPINYISGGIHVVKAGADIFRKVSRLIGNLSLDPETPQNKIVRELIKIDKKEHLTELIFELDDIHENIAEGAKRSAEMVRVLQTFTRSENENASAKIDLNENIQAVLKIMHSKWLYNNKIHLNSDDTLPQIYCLPSSINELLVSLLQNASEATEGRGEIRIGSRAEGDFAVISIEDNGCGIMPENAEKIYENFFTTKENKNGIGLTLVMDVIKKHGGKISFESEPGRTVFYVYLPFTPDFTKQ